MELPGGRGHRNLRGKGRSKGKGKGRDNTGHRIQAQMSGTASNFSDLQEAIEAAFQTRKSIDATTQGAPREAVTRTLDLMDRGQLRVAEKTGDEWHVNEWLKKAVLLSFRLNPTEIVTGGPGDAVWWDKVGSKFAGWGPRQFADAGFRAVPGALVRHSAHIAADVVLMPSFVNLGAFVDRGTMVDTWVTVGSCAQIGKNVHLSGGVGIGGVLEPLQASPVIIEDDCFIGARSEVVEGVIVGRGAVLSMGVYISASTRIFDRETGEIHYGHVPPWSVVVPGSLPSRRRAPAAGDAPSGASDEPHLYAAIIVKKVDKRTREKTAINELLRI